jgi:hypothetical protein
LHVLYQSKAKVPILVIEGISLPRSTPARAGGLGSSRVADTVTMR